MYGGLCELGDVLCELVFVYCGFHFFFLVDVCKPLVTLSRYQFDIRLMYKVYWNEPLFSAQMLILQSDFVGDY